MPKRRYFSESESEEEKNIPIPKKKKIVIQRPRIKFEELPSIKSLDDLIKIAETSKWYKNINNVMLWAILPHLKELQSMIGMKSVKESIFFQVIYYLQGLHLRNIDGDYLHTIITGKAGTGKTTVSKIIGHIYQNMGILSSSSNKFKVVSREDFIGEFLGSTAVKTKKLLTSCLGGCIFVDELYSLGPGQKDKDSYSKEAIDTINLFLSEHKNDFCFIGAGYKDDIDKCFFSVNQGLKRRFQWYHNIEDYQYEDLVDIFLKMVKDINWNINIDKKDLVDIFNKNKDLLVNGGGSCENLLSKIKVCHSIRVFGKEPEYKFVIVKEDVVEAFLLLKKFDMNKQPKITYDYFT
uniref:ATPase AAA-type core domain-containing protein n=1 Tax=viral metagenome TaxID=1070528 RepID=A0A6C0E1Z5_9ZZZZ